MRAIRTAAALFILSALFLSGCGMIIGQMMVAGTGVKEFRAVNGDLSSIKRGSNLLILAPFATKNAAYEPARGDFAARLSTELYSGGVFNTAFHFEHKPEAVAKRAAELAALSPEKLKETLGLDFAPDYLLWGTIEKSDTVVAPMHGVILEAAFTLEFTDLRTKAATGVYAEVKELYGQAIASVAAALSKNLK
ncbi:hypothetical protein FDZ71_04090 [bacterium]|nr:MAG: hypothetical protein FDZ71_04090 [bacterium]